ncbi:FMN-binding negative transcriptional regulator [Sporosarcina highlanderae]|uniref:FMN-binding negative transcriptional regulator n=1 Tax=Sporosarcina highlanderae TaxID=3035916 RepID=A0ABT8JUF9_9BACL|nr:FMN-binding negative transcriptional regulator [Sporosarcina highlanderae]MDN4608443.1 FMN-binding negative transcriptional regulator [Sporosarcina highlanderae]
MYIPKQFKVTDMNEIRDFVRENSFGTLVTTKKGRPVATHLPFQFIQKDDEWYVTGHMAYGNPQWRTFETCEEVLVMVQGPHAYVSSSWYSRENVPTWNYQAVHMYGKAIILTEEELVEDLTALLKKYEGHRENAVLWDTLSPELLDRELKGIVGFKVKVNEIQAAFKLSQNRNETDYNNIIDQLRNERDSQSKQVADQMEKK